MDILDLNEIKDGEFVTIINKDCLDCILCGDNSVPLVAKMMSEIYRVLAPDGHYMVIIMVMLEKNI